MKSTEDYNHPRECDVICARGKNFNSHLGNEVFLKAVRAKLKEYAEADGRFEKTLILSHMLATFRESGIRFFRLTEASSSAKLKKKKSFPEHMKYRFNEIRDERKIHEKIGHAFRDMLRAQSCNRSAITAKEKACHKPRSTLRGFPAACLLDDHGQVSHENSNIVRSCQERGHCVIEKHEALFHHVIHKTSIHKSHNDRDILGEENQDTRRLDDETSEVIKGTEHHVRQDVCAIETGLVERVYRDINPADWEELMNMDDDLLPHGMHVPRFPESKQSSVVTMCHTNVGSSESLNQEEEAEYADDITTASVPLALLQFWEEDYQNDDGDTRIKFVLDGLEKWMETTSCALPQHTMEMSLNINSGASSEPLLVEDDLLQDALHSISKEDFICSDPDNQDFAQCQNPLSELEYDLGYFD